VVQREKHRRHLAARREGLLQPAATLFRDHAAPPDRHPRPDRPADRRERGRLFSRTDQPEKVYLFPQGDERSLLPSQRTRGIGGRPMRCPSCGNWSRVWDAFIVLDSRHLHRRNTRQFEIYCRSLVSYSLRQRAIATGCASADRYMRPRAELAQPVLGIRAD
jgi:hypothetical protein